MFSSSMIKPAIYLAIITALIAFRQWDVHTHYQRGYDSAKVDINEQSKKELVSISDRFKEELETAQHEAKHFREIAVIMQNSKPVVLTKIKEKIVYENINTCTRINGLSELWNARAAEFSL